MKNYTKLALLSQAAAAVLFLAGCNSAADSSVPLESTKSEAVMSGGLIKSAQDKREYAYKQLPNGIKLIVVSDPEADKAAASLDVHIGHMADPADREGLSHYLEHMLFLGTGKYPEVGEYQKFISQHGGSNNAGTGQEHTSYFFQIDNAYLEPALDRFSRFFIDPLFDPEYVEKERNAVESEYSLRTKDDGRRYREALKQTGNQAHPATQFSVGNLSTLSDSEVSTIYDAVKAQYDKYYSADIMTLSVLGNYPTDQLMDWAVSKFSEVPSKGDNRDMDRPAPFLDEQLGVKVTINTLEDKRTLELHFALPPAAEYFRSKPVGYISTMLGHEGEGTLFAELKAKGYLKNMYTTTWGPDDFTLLNVHFDLTEDGHENLDEIADYFFSYVEKLKTKGVTQAAFEEAANIANLNFEFQDKFRISSYAGNITRTLQYLPPEHALDSIRVYENFDSALIKSFLDKITPENLRMIVATPDFDGEQREARYDVAYKMEPIPIETMEGWKQHRFMESVSLPKPNPYVAEDLEDKNNGAIDTPKLAFESDGIELWYVNENEFELPKSSLNLRVYPAKAYQSPAHKVALNLHSRVVGDLLASESYPASQAGLFSGVRSSGRAYNIWVQGYNDKIDVFLEGILDRLDPAKIELDVFNRLKKTYEQEIANRAFSQPINQVFTASSIANNPDGQDSTEQLAALEGLSFEQFKSLVTELQSNVEIEGVYNGNISKKDTVGIGEILKDRFKGKLNAGVKLPASRFTTPESDTDFVQQVSVDHADSTIVWSFEGDDDSWETRAKARLVEQILGPRFFKSLRTDQQYGYVVGMYGTENNGTPYTGFYIQSPKAHPSVLKAKIQEFMTGEVKHLETMSDKDFQGNKTGLLSDINKKYDNVYAKGNGLHGELINENLDFNTREKLTTAIESLTQEDLLGFYKTEFLSDARRSTVFWNIGKAHVDEASYDADAYDLCETKHCIGSRFR